MNPRLKKFIGTLVMVVFVILYALIVMTIAPRMVGPGTSKLVELMFYLIAGLAWALPLMPLIRWMERKPNPRT
ncbi:MAG: DUF2842 domain-containing protein [Methylobacterium sp.]|jgi:hypothetical protein|nr:DUF2842 domain-containing protein [Methylobacterium sp.]